VHDRERVLHSSGLNVNGYNWPTTGRIGNLDDRLTTEVFTARRVSVVISKRPEAGDALIILNTTEQ
jgi:hypothetical protein